MAYMTTHFWPGGTEAQYEATVAAVHPASGLPDGQTFHVAGPTDGGMLITAVWDSQEQYEKFLHEELLAKTIDGGFSGAPEERSAEVTNLVSA